MERMECVCPPSFLLLLVACVRPRVRTSFLGDMEGGVLDLRARGRRRAGKLASGASRARVLFFWVGESRGEVGGWGGGGGGGDRFHPLRFFRSRLRPSRPARRRPCPGPTPARTNTHRSSRTQCPARSRACPPTRPDEEAVFLFLLFSGRRFQSAPALSLLLLLTRRAPPCRPPLPCPTSAPSS